MERAGHGKGRSIYHRRARLLEPQRLSHLFSRPSSVDEIIRLRIPNQDRLSGRYDARIDVAPHPVLVDECHTIEALQMCRSHAFWHVQIVLACDTMEELQSPIAAAQRRVIPG